MKKVINLFFILVFIASGCSEENLHTSCEKTCDNESISKIFKSTEGLVREIKIGPDSEGIILDTIYVIQDQQNNILVPCNSLSPKFNKDSLRIKFSGYKMTCCNLITQPFYRVSYGCKFEITSIEVLEK